MQLCTFSHVFIEKIILNEAKLFICSDDWSLLRAFQLTFLVLPIWRGWRSFFWAGASRGSGSQRTGTRSLGRHSDIERWSMASSQWLDTIGMQLTVIKATISSFLAFATYYFNLRGHPASLLITLETNLGLSAKAMSLFIFFKFISFFIIGRCWLGVHRLNIFGEGIDKTD